MGEREGRDNSEFLAAFNRAKDELDEIAGQQRRLEIRKTYLLQTIAGLGPLVEEDIDLVYGITPGTSLADAIRLVAEYSAGKEEVITPLTIRDLLATQGYSLAEHTNHMASIHTAMKRMCRSGEFKSANWPSGIGYYWVGRKNVVREKARKAATAPRAAPKLAATGD